MFCCYNLLIFFILNRYLVNPAKGISDDEDDDEEDDDEYEEEDDDNDEAENFKKPSQYITNQIVDDK